MTAFHFEAKKYALRQAKDGVVVSFLVHPADVVPELLSAAIGEHYVVALAPYEEKAAEVEPTAAPAPVANDAPPKERRPFHTLPRSQQAAILINDENFREWWAETVDVPADEVDRSVKASLGITSKRDLDVPGPSANAWDELAADFRADTGRQTWERPA